MRDRSFSRDADKLFDPSENRAEKKVEVPLFSLFAEGRRALLRRQLKLLAGRRRDRVPERRHGGAGKSRVHTRGAAKGSLVSSYAGSSPFSSGLNCVRADSWIIADLRRPPRRAVNSAAVRDPFCHLSRCTTTFCDDSGGFNASRHGDMCVARRGRDEDATRIVSVNGDCIFIQWSEITLQRCRY